MHPSHHRTLTPSAIVSMLCFALVGQGSDARAATRSTLQEDTPRAQATWIEVLARLGSDERVAELELLRRAEGVAALLAQLAQDRETLQRAAATEIEVSGLTRQSSRHRAIQNELSAALVKLATVEEATTRTEEPAAREDEQASRPEPRDRAEVRSIIEDALMRGDATVLNQFGGAIEDVVAEHALSASHPAALLRSKSRVLATLADLSPGRAVEVALELSGRPGSGWLAAVSQSLGDPAVLFWRVDPLRLAGGAPAPAPFELALRLIESDEIHSWMRAACALPFLSAGVDDPRLLAAAEALAPEMRGMKEFRSADLRWWHDRLLASGSPERRQAAVQARLTYAGAGDLALLDQLLGDPDPANRVAVASFLPDALPDRAPVSPEYRALWTRALADPAMEVRREASRALVERAREGTFPLTAKAAMELVLALDDPTDAEARAALLAEVGYVIKALPTVVTSHEELGEVYAALLDSRLAEVTSGVLRGLTSAHKDVPIAVLTHLGAPAPEVAAGLNSMLGGYNILRNASSEACLRAFAHLLQRPQPPAELVEATRLALRERSRQHSLDALPAVDAVEVLLRSVGAAPELVEGFLMTSRWERCRDALAAASTDARHTRMQRNVALIAIERARPSGPASAAALADSIAATFQDESERASAPSLVTWATWALDEAPSAHCALLVALLARAEIPTEAFGRVLWTEASAEALTAEEKRALLDALERRADAAGRSGRVPFESLALTALAVMQEEPSLVRRALVTRWSESETTIASATAAAVRSSDASLKAAVRGRILAALEGDLPGKWRATWIASLIHLTGPLAAADDIAELAATVGKPELVTTATELLESSAKLREVGARLGASTAGASRDAAVTEVVALLDAPDEAVRVEAIRGLATLGAVEHLPRLIRIVGKGTPAERTAARAALDSLHQRATRESQQTPPVQAPPTEARDQARDGEAPR